MTLTALVIGIPLALVGLAGSPLPASVPRWSAILHALGQSEVADSTLIKGAALVCFVAWGALVVCVVVEVAAWAAGRAAIRLPVVGPLQLWVARLVASAFLVFSSFVGTTRPAGAATLRPVAAVARMLPPDGASPEEAAVAARPALSEPAGAKRYIVDPPNGRQRDTLWGIAERHLGNPERWPEIFQLNKDRVTAGHRLTNPHWIYAGEELIMPADAVGLDPIDVAPDAAPVQSPLPPSAAKTETSDAPVEMQVIPDDQPRPQAAGDPSQKRSDGWRLVRNVTDLLPTRVTTLAVTVGGVFAATVVAAVERKRRRRQRAHRPGAPSLVPDQTLAGAELALRLAADLEASELLQIALRIARRDAPMAEVLGVGLGPRQLVLRFVNAPPTAAAPFRSVGDGWVLFRRAISHDVRTEADALPSVALPLVTLGTGDEDETVLLNVAAGRRTTVAGTRATARGFLSAAATELATGGWCGTGRRLVTVGLATGFAALDGVIAADSVADINEVAAGDIVVSIEPLGPLASAVPEGAAVLAVGPLDGSQCRLVIGEESLEVDRLGLVVRPHTLSEELVDDIVDLIEPEASVAREPVAPAPQSEESLGIGRVTPPPEVEVRVMGPIEIAGAEKPLARAKSIELVTYLAMHRDALVDADRLREALWPGRPPGTTLYTTASVARNHLGRSANGEHHLPLLPNGERVYRVAKSVGTDYERFSDAVQRARGERPADAIATLRSALELVRGRPFDVASRGFEWAHVEGFIVCMENEIADAAHQLARLCLDAGDPEGARWATRQGLRASVANEQLYRDEMEAADLAGNPAGVEALLGELSHVIEEDDPLEALHPETVALYNKLTRTQHLARTAS